ncbi:zinc-alpha-2-glycoprotein-like [Triplophysa rosa]|uniref:MHC class I protein n=1 Tax=Triplophysa rosa TaxID=992332 RepID=A0A9W7TL63_TRIRA|nr:zinc-alpha-2-glycoprotein-like [Triplophysa rosa]KAI7799235.1 MHC class I protein [Triplophysa rosa]
MCASAALKLLLLAHMKWKFKVLMVFGFFVQTLVVHCETHYLQYVYTVTSEQRGASGPVYSAVGVCDDVQISHYSDEQQKWIKGKVWINGSVEPPDSKERILNLYYSMANCTKSKCHEPHTLQRRVGCQVEKSSSEKVMIQMAYDDYGFDGVDFITLNFKTMQWTDKKEKAAEIKMKWNSDTDRREYFRAYLSHCLTWISTNGYSTTQSPPNIQMFAKKAPRDQRKMDLTCLATGFYPKHLQMDITMNGSKLESPAGVRPNDDKTFQLRTTVRINKEEKRGFACHVTHSSLSQPNITKWDGTCMNCHEESRTHVAAGVAVVAVASVAAVLVTLKCVYRKKTLNVPRLDEEGQGQTNSRMPLNAAESPATDEPHTATHLGQTNGFHGNGESSAKSPLSV